MDDLPDDLIQFILSKMQNIKDIVASKCVSKRWKESLPYITSLYFPRKLFKPRCNVAQIDRAILQVISSIVKLETLIIYTRFSNDGLFSWLSSAGIHIRHLELRLDNVTELGKKLKNPSKIDALALAKNLESLKLWAIHLRAPPKWNGFPKLTSLEVVGLACENSAVTAALKACPNLKNLLLLGCDGVTSLEISLPSLEHCKLDFIDSGNCSLTVQSPRIQSLDVQGCARIRIPNSNFLQALSISNNFGIVSTVEVEKLCALENLSLRGAQWRWEAISTLLNLASEVKHLYMKIEFTGEHNDLLPFPEIDFAQFFRSHPKLRKFDLHGAMFAALCQQDLETLDPYFSIPCLEELIVTIRSPLNAEQKICTLESFAKYGKNLKSLVIRILQMKSNHCSVDDFFEDVCKFRETHRQIVKLE